MPQEFIIIISALGDWLLGTDRRCARSRTNTLGGQWKKTSTGVGYLQANVHNLMTFEHFIFHSVGH
jgi:hypothetical protein